MYEVTKQFLRHISIPLWGVIWVKPIIACSSWQKSYKRIIYIAISYPVYTVIPQIFIVH